MRRPPPSSCRTISTNSDAKTPARAHRHRRLLLAVAGGVARQRAAARACTSPTRATRRRAVRRDPAGRRLGRDSPASARRRRRVRRSHPARRAVVVRPSRALQAGEYRFDQPMSAARRRREDRQRRRLHAAPHVSRGPDHRARWRRCTNRAASVRRADSSRPRATPRWSRISTREPATSRAICFRKPIRCRAAPTPRSVVAMMVDRFRASTTTRCAARAERSSLTHAAGRHAGVADREGDRARPRSARSWRRCTATG